MKVKQIYTIVNEVNKQAYGEKMPQVVDLTGLIATGNTVLSSQANKDLWFGTLADKIGKQIIVNRVYKSKYKKLILDKITFGAAIEKIRVEPGEATANAAWTLQDGDPLSPPNAKFANVKAKIFESRNTYRFEVTIFDYQINSAFTSESALQALISAIYVALDNDVEKTIEGLIKMAQVNFIAEKINYKKNNPGVGIHAINVLSEYNEETNAGLTVAAALRNADFYKWFYTKFADTIDAMKEYSVLFNTDKYHNFTPAERMNIIMLNKFARGFDAYLQSDTYHNEITALPGYDSTAYWQGIGDNTFDAVSTIDVTTSDGNTVKQTGIIAFVFDTEALGVMFDEPRQDVYVDVNHDVNHVMYKGTKGFFNDFGENAVVFYIAEDDADAGVA